MQLTDNNAEVEARAEPARILVIFGNIPLLGQERGNIQALQTLREAGHDVLFVTNDAYGHESIQPALDARGIAWTTGTYPGFFSARMGLGEWGTRLKEWVKGNLDFLRAARAFKPTHVHAGNERFLLNLLPAVWLLRVPVVMRVGDDPRQHHALFRLIWRALLIPSVTRFVAISEFIAERLRNAGVPDERIRVIYSHPPQRLAPDELFSVEPFDGKTVAYVGQLSAEKGVGELVEAALQLCRARDDVRFFLAGDYTWQNPFAEALIARVEAAGLADRIRFLGYIDDVPGLLRVSDIHVCPSVWEEPLSNVVPEAKRSGAPSVIFASGGLPELVEHGVDGWICETKTAGALRDEISYVLDLSQATLQAMGDAARVSLQRLGITSEQFRMAWHDVYSQ